MGVSDQVRFQVGREGGHRQIRAELASEIEGDPEILPVESDLEAERVVVRDHPTAPIGEDPALSGPASQRLDDLADIETGLHREHDPLGDAEVRPGEDHLVDRFDRLPGADRADMGDGLAERGKDGPGPLDVRLLATDEDRERRLLGALAAARHRSVDHRDARQAQAGAEVTGRGRRDRRAVDDERAGSGAGGQPVSTEEDGFDIGRVGHADHDDVARPGDGGRRFGPVGTQLVELRRATGTSDSRR